MKKQESGIVSLEACIVLPIFILLMMFFYGFIVMYTGENLMQHSLIQSANSLSLDSYAKERYAANKNDLFGPKKGILDMDTENFLGNAILLLYQNRYDKDSPYAGFTNWYGDKDHKVLEEAIKERFVAFLADGDERKADSIL